MIDVYLFLEEAAGTSQTFSPTMLAVLAGAASAVVTGIISYLAGRRQSRANVGQTEADIAKTKVDTVSLTIDKLIELTNKFKVAQDEYILLKDKFAQVSRDFEDFKITVHELLYLMQAVLVNEPPNSLLRKQVEKIKAEFFVTSEGSNNR